MAEISRLPGPVSDLWDWQLVGSCREADPALFFHPEGERGPARRARDAAALAICASCPVITPCRAHSLRVREPYGVWGGLTEDDRERIYAERREDVATPLPLPVAARADSRIDSLADSRSGADEYRRAS